MKRWSFLLLFAGFLLGITWLWLFRLSLLPFFISIIATWYGIDRVRYTEAHWKRPQEIIFYELQIDKGGWRLSTDSLRIKLDISRKIQIRRGTLEAILSSPTKSALAERDFSSYPLLRALRLLSSIDTLEWQELCLPQDFELSLLKEGDTCRFILSRAGSLIRGVAEIKASSVNFSLQRGSYRTAKGDYMSWEQMEGFVEAQPMEILMEVCAQQLTIYHRYLAQRVLGYSQVGLYIHGKAEKDTLRLQIDPLLLPLTARLSVWGHKRGAPLYLRLQVPAQSHQAYIQAFPKGFLTCLSEATLGGTSALDLFLQYDPKLEDTLEMRVDWRPAGFAIYHWGGRNPLTLRESFLYQPYASNRLLWIGPESPNYLSFYQITPYVLHAVLHSEDGIFFYHEGFQKERFLKALLENWRCRCFRRGAGTITMQLVRNLLLTREKTLARKVEEILLTALIERFRLLSKQRIAELYLNIVEWGPEIYGLTEAARFYFGKEPHELTIPEAIFLGMLLPSPKAYLFFVDKERGCALPNLKTHFQTIARFLVLQNYLAADSVEAIIPERVCLQPPAWSLPPSLN
ncbi:MAG: biosynthetic peptidoglycan transglycosylase [Bacteroidia bacterium]|nr:transglycosylase domain-containing protein [Bacteroidia bacterium]MDW8015419.1 biosynthetic peptidoglycan transglycosylase [Bacteroidia bacterium]